MNDALLKLISNSDAATHLKMKSGNFVVDDTIGISLLFSAFFLENPGKYLLVTSNLYIAQKVSDSIASLIGEENVLLFPFDDMLRNETVTSSKELLAQRLFVLSRALENKPIIIVAHTSSLVMPLTLVDDFINATFDFKVGEKYDLSLIKEKLAKAGYERVNKIDQTLQFASRGDILDIYPSSHDFPIRLEFFGDELESIHYFVIDNQLTKKELTSVKFEAANDIIFSDYEIEDFKERLESKVQQNSKSLNEDLANSLKQNSDVDFEHISSRIYHPQFYKYVRFIKQKTASVIDYFKPDIIFLSNNDQIRTTYEFINKETRDYFDSMFKLGKMIKGLDLYNDLEKVLNSGKTVLFSRIFRKNTDEIEFKVNPLIYSKGNSGNIKILLGQYVDGSSKTILALSNKQQFDTVLQFLKSEGLEYEILEGLDLPKKKLGITLFDLEEGFELPDLNVAFISSRELFGYQNRTSRFLNRFKEATILRTYEELVPGDYVVHEYYGIGKFLKIETLEIDGIHRDFIYLKFAGNGSLYVPLNQFRLLRKYAGREGAEPKLSNINTDDWERTKKRIKSRINELADRLFALYSERAQGKGFAFPVDDEFQAAFEKEFPYELTKDQEKAVISIKKDMESPNVMDRLLCGDVGFGKTEVAFRAAFKAINAGKQVAILCPTTLLARQHYELALERFRNFGVNIAIISRLVQERIQKEHMKSISEGKVHLVIGTHRLLNKDFKFKDLGLLIVDEEQRFGVEQKERIKEIKTNIDVLSLSATPIPRTLQLSLIGVRPVSQINTPPENRSSIQTYVSPYNEGVIRELIERELSRKGQVFYIHNVVSSIHLKARTIQNTIPSATVGVIHGQMDKELIEDTMMRFYSGEIDVLVATSIVENGIDIPNANLIIVEDADKFGLSQLYQIKGRVGRGNRIAYAYLFFNENKTLNKNAQKRLKAIQDFAQLGSGYKIAQRDLMIRGAGDILGPEQAGFIDSIGLELYLKLLNEVIEERRTGVVHEPPKPVKMFHIDAYIPDEYMSKEDKIELYQEIENAKNIKDLQEIKLKIRNIYGRIPKEVLLLLNKRRIDILISNEEFETVNEYSDFIEIILSQKFSSKSGIGSTLFESLSPYLDKITVNYLHKVLKIRLKKEGNWLKDLETIIENISTIYKKYKKLK